MAKKTSDNRPIPKDDPSRILQTTVEDVMHQSMIPYAEHVILERALPRVEDGLKPVQRRIRAGAHGAGLLHARADGRWARQFRLH